MANPTFPSAQARWLGGHASESQKSARLAFDRIGFPSARDERFRYTPLTALTQKAFIEPTPAQTELQVIHEVPLEGAIQLIFINGLFSGEHSSSLAHLPKGLRIRIGAQDAVAAARLLEPPTSEALAHGFELFSRAYATDGSLIEVDAGCVIETPIHLLHIATLSDHYFAYRHHVRLGRDARLSLIESHTGQHDESALTVSVTTAKLDERAQLDHLKLQKEGKGTIHFGAIDADQAKDARFTQRHVALGAGIARAEIHARLDQGADCQLDGLFVATDKRHLDTQTLLHHTGPGATSRERYRGIANGRGRGIFTGRIVVDRAAQKTQAEMNCKNLLLSDQAEIDSRPQLEIHADDVRCAHGLTVGQLDENAVFFLRSRGIEEPEARQILTRAFAAEIIEDLQPAPLKQVILAALLHHLDPQPE